MQWLHRPARRSQCVEELCGRLATTMATHEKYLILGSNSFSGATFVDHLAAEGRDVLGNEPLRGSASRRSCPTNGRCGRERYVSSAIDLNHDLDALKALLERERPTHVVNFAAQSMVGESWQHPGPLDDDQCRLDACGCTNCCATTTDSQRYVHVTTPEVYGSTDGWVTENAPPSIPRRRMRCRAPPRT